MKELNYWQQFLNTGRIDDYLKFRENQENPAGMENVTGEHIIMGDNPYAGICKVNRNSVEDSAYRGLR